VAFRST